MAEVICERCGRKLTAPPGCLHLCVQCGLGYSFQWRLSDQNQFETVTWTHSAPSAEERAPYLQWLQAQKGTILTQLSHAKGPLYFHRRRALQLTLRMIQRQIDSRTK